MTHFAQLEKIAAATEPQLINPYAQAAQNPTGSNWGRAGAELAADVGFGWNPFTGVPWFGGKAINDFTKGRWGSGLMNLGFGALSFLPGGGSIGAGVKGGLSGVKGLAGASRAASALQTGGKIGQGVGRGIRLGGGGAAATGFGMDMASPGAAPPASDAYTTPTVNPLHRQMVDSLVNQ